MTTNRKSDAATINSNIETKGIIKTLKIYSSIELHSFEVEIPAFKQTIELAVSIPVCVTFNPYTESKIIIGVQQINVDDFIKRVRQVIHKHNLGKKKFQQINIEDDIIIGIYNMIQFTDKVPGDTISIEVPIPKRWFKLKTGKYGFKWNNALSPKLFIISEEPHFNMIKSNGTIEGIKYNYSKVFTYVRGDYRKDIYGGGIFNINPDGKHYLIKNIINNRDCELDKYDSIYYTCGEYDGARNEYIIIPIINHKEDIEIKTIKDDTECTNKPNVETDTSTAQSEGNTARSCITSPSGGLDVSIEPSVSDIIVANVDTNVDSSIVIEPSIEDNINTNKPTIVIDSTNAEDFIEQLEKGKRKNSKTDSNTKGKTKGNTKGKTKDKTDTDN